MVQGQALTDADPAVVADQVERVEAQLGHDLDLVLRGGALAIDAQVPCGGGRFAAVAIAAQIGRHHGVVPGQPGGHLVPLDVGLGIPVEQQQGRSTAAVHQVDGRAVRLDPGFCEAFEHGPLPKQ